MNEAQELPSASLAINDIASVRYLAYLSRSHLGHREANSSAIESRILAFLRL